MFVMCLALKATYFIPFLILLFHKSNSLDVAKFFRSHMVLQEAPNSAALFGTSQVGPVVVNVDCDSGLSFGMEAQLVRGCLLYTSPSPRDS